MNDLFSDIAHKRFVHTEVPYFSQWESRDLVHDILTYKLLAQEDPLWQNSGARSPDEYALWSWNACGMACVKMILTSKFGQSPPLVELCHLCEKQGGYIVDSGVIQGLYYAPCISMIGHDFGLSGQVAARLSIQEIITNLADEKFVIASVHPMIRYPQDIPPKQGGHLVLVVGYDLNKETVYIQNPSGDSHASQEYCEVSFQDFNKFFGQRGMIIW
jgi:Peptidase_C39 like family